MCRRNGAAQARKKRPNAHSHVGKNKRNITVEITTGKNNIGLKNRLVYSYWKCPGRIDFHS